jgi:sulfur-oxidizing protein SoxX
LRHWFIIVFVSAFATLLAACGAEAEIDPKSIGDPGRGREIFENGTELISTTYTKCHSLDGTVPADPRHPRRLAPSLLGVSARAGDRAQQLGAVEYLRQSILDPNAYIVEGYEDDMDKGYKYGLSEVEVDDLVAFLLTQ